MDKPPPPWWFWVGAVGVGVGGVAAFASAPLATGVALAVGMHVRLHDDATWAPAYYVALGASLCAVKKYAHCRR